MMGKGRPLANAPPRTLKSIGFSAEALTSTSKSCGPGVGAGTSCNVKTSAEPNFGTTMARMSSPTIELLVARRNNSFFQLQMLFRQDLLRETVASAIRILTDATEVGFDPELCARAKILSKLEHIRLGALLVFGLAEAI